MNAQRAIGAILATLMVGGCAPMASNDDAWPVSTACPPIDAPVPIGDRPAGTSITVDAERVYWTDHQETIWSAPLDGGPPTRVAQGYVFASHLSVDEKDLYWINGIDGVTKRSKDGKGELEWLATDLSWPHYTAVDEKYVYTSAEYTGLLRIPKDGGPYELIADGSYSLLGLALDETSIYFDDQSVEVDGNRGAIVRMDRYGGERVELVSPSDEIWTGYNSPSESGVAVDDTHVYWLPADSLYDHRIYRVPKTGGAPELIVSDIGTSEELVVDGDYVYWASGPEIFKAPKAGGESVLLASTSDQRLDGLAVGPRFVYFLSNDLPVKVCKDPPE